MMAFFSFVNWTAASEGQRVLVMMSPRQPKWKTKNTKKINHSKPVKPVLLGMNMVFLCPNREDRTENLHISIGNDRIWRMKPVDEDINSVTTK
ncbi:hypothetical protein G5714_021106 [Onychostoma macrolepis]|uniref:Uncharacterized protein n=1 Tax=Onychostoma macrolepis TaxID=369639 RepID=A0A7J6BVR0_9TELE|nr:hypothetical protein G5714_021106 [Onychostoma macrolepis]